MSGRGHDWEETISEDGRFSVRFPGTPFLEEGKKGRRAYRLLLDEGRVVYSVMYFDLSYTEERAKDIELQNETLDAMTVSLVQQSVREPKVRPTSLAGYPGRDLRAELPEGLMIWERIHLVDRRLYFVTAAGEGSIDELEAEVFHGSFRLSSSRDH